MASTRNRAYWRLLQQSSGKFRKEGSGLAGRRRGRNDEAESQSVVRGRAVQRNRSGGQRHGERPQRNRRLCFARQGFLDGAVAPRHQQRGFRGVFRRATAAFCAAVALHTVAVGRMRGRGGNRLRGESCLRQGGGGRRKRTRERFERPPQCKHKEDYPRKGLTHNVLLQTDEADERPR